MGPALIVAILSIAIALVTLWLVSDVIKKVEIQFEIFLHTHISEIREEIRGANQAHAELAKKVDALTKDIAYMDNLRNGIAKVAEDLNKLDLYIQQRDRDHVVKPEKIKPKPKSGAKST